MKNRENRPYIFEIEPTNYCPYSCIMCPQGLGRMKRQVGFMEMDTFKIVLEQIPSSQKLVRLHHFGEAVFHPRINDMIKSVKEHGLFSLISINPASLTPKLNQKIIESGVDIVCFSLDALDSEGLKMIRGIKRSYEDCWAMIVDFIDKSRKSNKKILKVIQMVCLDANIKDRKKFYDIKKKYPEFDILLHLAENKGFGDLEIVEQTLAGGSSYVLPGKPCTAPFSDVVILWNGDVVLCCYDYDGFNVIGNVHEEKLSDMWQNDKVRQIRDVFKNRQAKSLLLCDNCFLAPHNFAGNPKLKVKNADMENDYPLFFYLWTAYLNPEEPNFLYGKLLRMIAQYRIKKTIFRYPLEWLVFKIKNRLHNNLAKLKNFIRFNIYQRKEKRKRAAGLLQFDADGLTTKHYAPFLTDKRFNKAYAAAIHPLKPKNADVRYRGYVIQWAVSQVRELEGDFVECGTYNAKIATLILNLEDFCSKNRIFHLFDTFSGIPAQRLTRRELNLRYAGQYSDITLEEVQKKLNNYLDVVRFHQGFIPDSFQGITPEPVAFLHLDLNIAYPTQKALEFFYPVLVQGAVIVFDDYGWTNYEDQRDIVDLFFADKKEDILVLPTGQGVVIKK